MEIKENKTYEKKVIQHQMMQNKRNKKKSKKQEFSQPGKYVKQNVVSTGRKDIKLSEPNSTILDPKFLYEFIEEIIHLTSRNMSVLLLKQSEKDQQKEIENEEESPESKEEEEKEEEENEEEETSKKEDSQEDNEEEEQINDFSLEPGIKTFLKNEHEKMFRKYSAPKLTNKYGANLLSEIEKEISELLKNITKFNFIKEKSFELAHALNSVLTLIGCSEIFRVDSGLLAYLKNIWDLLYILYEYVYDNGMNKTNDDKTLAPAKYLAPICNFARELSPHIRKLIKEAYKPKDSEGKNLQKFLTDIYCKTYTLNEIEYLNKNIEIFMGEQLRLSELNKKAEEEYSQGQNELYRQRQQYKKNVEETLKDIKGAGLTDKTRNLLSEIYSQISIINENDPDLEEIEDDLQRMKRQKEYLEKGGLEELRHHYVLQKEFFNSVIESMLKIKEYIEQKISNLAENQTKKTNELNEGRAQLEKLKAGNNQFEQYITGINDYYTEKEKKDYNILSDIDSFYGFLAEEKSLEVELKNIQLELEKIDKKQGTLLEEYTAEKDSYAEKKKNVDLMVDELNRTEKELNENEKLYNEIREKLITCNEQYANDEVEKEKSLELLKGMEKEYKEIIKDETQKEKINDIKEEIDAIKQKIADDEKSLNELKVEINALEPKLKEYDKTGQALNMTVTGLEEKITKANENLELDLQKLLEMDRRIYGQNRDKIQNLQNLKQEKINFLNQAKEKQESLQTNIDERLGEYNAYATEEAEKASKEKPVRIYNSVEELKEDYKYYAAVYRDELKEAQRSMIAKNYNGRLEINKLKSYKTLVKSLPSLIDKMQVLINLYENLPEKMKNYMGSFEKLNERKANYYDKLNVLNKENEKLYVNIDYMSPENLETQPLFKSYKKLYQSLFRDFLPDKFFDKKIDHYDVEQITQHYVKDYNRDLMKAIKEKLKNVGLSKEPLNLMSDQKAFEYHMKNNGGIPVNIYKDSFISGDFKRTILDIYLYSYIKNEKFFKNLFVFAPAKNSYDKTGLINFYYYFQPIFINNITTMLQHMFSVFLVPLYNLEKYDYSRLHSQRGPLSRLLIEIKNFQTDFYKDILDISKRITNFYSVSDSGEMNLNIRKQRRRKFAEDVQKTLAKLYLEKFEKIYQFFEMYKDLWSSIKNNNQSSQNISRFGGLIKRPFVGPKMWNSNIKYTTQLNNPKLDMREGKEGEILSRIKELRTRYKELEDPKSILSQDERYLKMKEEQEKTKIAKIKRYYDGKIKKLEESIRKKAEEERDEIRNTLAELKDSYKNTSDYFLTDYIKEAIDKDYEKGSSGGAEDEKDEPLSKKKEGDMKKEEEGDMKKEEEDIYEKAEKSLNLPKRNVELEGEQEPSSYFIPIEFEEEERRMKNKRMIQPKKQIPRPFTNFYNNPFGSIPGNYAGEKIIDFTDPNNYIGVKIPEKDIVKNLFTGMNKENKKKIDSGTESDESETEEKIKTKQNTKQKSKLKIRTRKSNIITNKEDLSDGSGDESSQEPSKLKTKKTYSNDNDEDTERSIEIKSKKTGNKKDKNKKNKKTENDQNKSKKNKKIKQRESKVASQNKEGEKDVLKKIWGKVEPRFSFKVEGDIIKKGLFFDEDGNIVDYIGRLLIACDAYEKDEDGNIVDAKTKGIMIPMEEAKKIKDSVSFKAIEKPGKQNLYIDRLGNIYDEKGLLIAKEGTYIRNKMTGKYYRQKNLEYLGNYSDLEDKESTIKPAPKYYDEFLPLEDTVHISAFEEIGVDKVENLEDRLNKRYLSKNGNIVDAFGNVKYEVGSFDLIEDTNTAKIKNSNDPAIVLCTNGEGKILYYEDYEHAAIARGKKISYVEGKTYKIYYESGPGLKKGDLPQLKSIDLVKCLKVKDKNGLIHLYDVKTLDRILSITPEIRKAKIRHGILYDDRIDLYNDEAIDRIFTKTAEISLVNSQRRVLDEYFKTLENLPELAIEWRDRFLKEGFFKNDKDEVCMKNGMLYGKFVDTYKMNYQYPTEVEGKIRLLTPEEELIELSNKDLLDLEAVKKSEFDKRRFYYDDEKNLCTKDFGITFEAKDVYVNENKDIFGYDVEHDFVKYVCNEKDLIEKPENKGATEEKEVGETQRDRLFNDSDYSG